MVIVDLAYENHGHGLSGGRFLVVFLVGANVGGIEKTLRRPRCVSVEDRADGSERVAGIARTGAMVLSPERSDEPLSLHAQYELVRR